MESIQHQSQYLKTQNSANQYGRLLFNESTKFLDSIGTAEMIQGIERKVVSMTSASKETIENETGISSSFDEKDMREYLEEAIQEIKRVRNKGNH